MHDELKKAICLANLELQRQKLVICNWGNVSGIDRQAGIIAIKPSGVAYDELSPEKIVIVDMDGKVVEGKLRPSSDTATHLELYRSFKEIGGICHTHSQWATTWAQAFREIPCLGTTHADYCYGPIPVTKMLTQEQVKSGYEINTGKVIVERFANLNPLEVPAVLAAGHGPFTWAKTAAGAVEAALILEQLAQMAAFTFAINPAQAAIPGYLLDKHYLRKHGKDAYYGQK